MSQEPHYTGNDLFMCLTPCKTELSLRIQNIRDMHSACFLPTNVQRMFRCFPYTISSSHANSTSKEASVSSFHKPHAKKQLIKSNMIHTQVGLIVIQMLFMDSLSLFGADSCCNFSTSSFCHSTLMNFFLTSADILLSAVLPHSLRRNRKLGSSICQHYF